MNTGRIAAVVLAAGKSARMGASGNKLLMEWDGEPLVRRAARAALDSGIDEVFVVIPAGATEIASTLRNLHVRVVENAGHAEGIASSIRCGIGAVTPACNGALVLLADMPLISPRHLSMLLSAFAATDDTAASVVVPCHRGQRGNPVLWGRDHFSELMRLHGDIGARDLLAHRNVCMIRVETGDDAVLVDIDSPQDWARLHSVAS
jgi:molybdenum cofactor cytidylyltransferase